MTSGAHHTPTDRSGPGPSCDCSHLSARGGAEGPVLQACPDYLREQTVLCFPPLLTLGVTLPDLGLRCSVGLISSSPSCGSLSLVKSVTFLISSDEHNLRGGWSYGPCFVGEKNEAQRREARWARPLSE